MIMRANKQVAFLSSHLPLIYREKSSEKPEVTWMHSEKSTLILRFNRDMMVIIIY